MAKMWSAPKRFGHGASIPKAWEGWAVYLGYVAALFLVLSFPADLLAPQVRAAGQIGAFVVLTFALLTITRAKAEGGWRWRWGRD